MVYRVIMRYGRKGEGLESHSLLVEWYHDVVRLNFLALQDVALLLLERSLQEL